ncbi:hypothetical protein SCHPADRAFT_826837 [Schizopora paradoxa]|uniref:RING-type E3 ubiquitin transferase n=1 Tax=Schizopora paradoxa TaxID=27342 RepID=A0A0H2RQP3_9AGAM|nr:hypothetical protein SCHPADRAFT_826837 [Schizopora paradoxa]
MNTSNAAPPAPGQDDKDEADNTSKEVATETKVENVKSEAAGDVATCWICVEPIKYYSLSECNHRTCHVCALRLRALYKNMDCTFCKHPQEVVVFTSSPDALFSEYDIQNMPLKDSKLSIFFEAQEMMDDSLMLLRFNCPDPECPFIARGWNDLRTHVKVLHKKMMCDICIRFKKVFAHEHTLYSTNQLYLHVPSLSHRPQRNKDKTDDAHPLCEFCRDCFFDDDGLYAHMRERHEECFVCKRAGVQHQYFKDYKQLELHFTTDHYPCTQASCLEKKFVVFGSAMDLQGHLMEEHGSTMTVKDKKEARKVTAEFQFEDSGQSEGRRRRDREPPPSSSSSQSQRPPDRRRANFGAALTEDNTAASGSNTPVPQGRRSRSASPNRENLDPVVAERHALFMAKVRSLTSNSTASEASIRAAIKSYRASESAARDLISTFYVVMDNHLEKTQSLVTPLVDLLDVDKKKDLLEAWNGFKIEQQKQFPDLVPAGPNSAYAGVASGRIINLKHSYGQSSRVWDRVARAAASTTSASSSSRNAAPSFPTLSSNQRVIAAGPVVNTQPYRQPQRTTPWTGSSSSSSPAPENIGRTASSANGSRSKAAGGLSNAAFPALPKAAPQTKPQVSGNVSLRNIIGPQGPEKPAWGVSGKSGKSELPESEEVEEEEKEQVQGKGKGKGKGKNKKITLFTMGQLSGQLS